MKQDGMRRKRKGEKPIKQGFLPLLVCLIVD
jgi:hypothetical protein